MSSLRRGLCAGRRHTDAQEQPNIKPSSSDVLVRLTSAAILSGSRSELCDHLSAKEATPLIMQIVILNLNS